MLLFVDGKTSLLVFSVSSKPTTRSSHLFPSIHFDISPLSRKHSSGTARRLIRASFSAKATCFDVGSRSMSDTGLQLGLRLDPGAERPAVLLNLPGQEGLVAQGERARIGDLLGRRGQGMRGAVHRETPLLAWPSI